MIMTILKQTIRFHLDEKDFEISNVYADLYSKMVLQYVNNRQHAISALKDLAYEFYINALYRNAEKYYMLVSEHYGITALNENDLLHLGDIYEKLDHLNEAMTYYQRIVRYFPHSHQINVIYQKIGKIFDLCNNRNKADIFKSLSNIEKFSSRHVKQFKREKQHKKSA